MDKFILGDIVKVVDTANYFPGCVGEIIHVKNGTYVLDLLYHTDNDTYRCIGYFTKFQLEKISDHKKPAIKYKVVGSYCKKMRQK